MTEGSRQRGLVLAHAKTKLREQWRDYFSANLREWRNAGFGFIEDAILNLAEVIYIYA
jgi:hypothetical protein